MVVWVKTGVVNEPPVANTVLKEASYQFKVAVPVAVKVAVVPAQIVAGVPTGAAGVGLTVTTTVVAAD